MSDTPKYLDPRFNPFLPCNIPEWHLREEGETIEPSGLVPLPPLQPEALVTADDLRGVAGLVFAGMAEDVKGLDVQMSDGDFVINGRRMLDLTDEDVQLLLAARESIKGTGRELDAEQYLRPASNPFIKL